MSERKRSEALAQRLFAGLRYRNNRVFWIGTSISSIAQASYMVAASWLAYQEGGGSAAGMVAFAVMSPFLISTPIGGMLADKFDRRSLVLITQALQGFIALVMAILALFGEIPIALLVSLVFISSAARTIELPTVAAVLPNLVPANILLNNFSLNSLATLGSRFAGPALLIPILSVGGAGIAFFLVAAAYVPALLWTRMTPPMPRLKPTTANHPIDAPSAITYIRERPTIMLLLVLVLTHCAFTMSFDALLPMVAETSLGGEGGLYSSLVAVGGIGAIVVSLYMAAMRGGTQRGLLFLWSAFFSAFGCIMLAFAGNLPAAIGSMLIIGSSQAAFMTLVTTFVQETVSDNVRGRIASAFMMAGGGMMSFGNLLSGTLGERYSVMPVLVIPGMLFIATIILLTFSRADLRAIFRRGTVIVATAPAGD